MAGNSIADDLESLSVGDNDRKIVVGIDFGTTFSGVAWAETRRVSPELFRGEDLVVTALTYGSPISSRWSKYGQPIWVRAKG
jgi:hypothetical protein